jgi:ethanolamine utilization protein EutN
VQLARVVGTVVATHKDEKLVSVTLLLIQPLSSAREPAGRALVAADAMGAGVGEEVFFVRGAEASFPFYPVVVPTDAAIVGIVDRVDT